MNSTYHQTESNTYWTIAGHLAVACVAALAFACATGERLGTTASIHEASAQSEAMEFARAKWPGSTVEYSSQIGAVKLVPLIVTRRGWLASVLSNQAGISEELLTSLETRVLKQSAHSPVEQDFVAGRIYVSEAYASSGFCLVFYMKVGRYGSNMYWSLYEERERKWVILHFGVL
jgi:hypothetical protein